MSKWTDDIWVEKNQISESGNFKNVYGVRANDFNIIVNNIFYLYSQLKSKNIV